MNKYQKLSIQKAQSIPACSQGLYADYVNRIVDASKISGFPSETSASSTSHFILGPFLMQVLVILDRMSQ